MIGTAYSKIPNGVDDGTAASPFVARRGDANVEARYGDAIFGAVTETKSFAPAGVMLMPS